MAVLFDTLKLAERLEAAGAGERHRCGVGYRWRRHGAGEGDPLTMSDEPGARLRRAMIVQAIVIIAVVAVMIGLAAAFTSLFR